MKSASLSQQRLAELLVRFSACRIAVVGDFFLDKYLDVDPAWEEISLETGKPAHQVAAIRVSPGAAGTVVSNLKSLGAGEIHIVGFTGDDGEGFELRRCLMQLGCQIDHLITLAERFTPTYLKPHDLTQPGLEGEHSRYDTKNHTPTPSAVEENVVRSLEHLVSRVDAVIVLDQVEQKNCGVITTTVRNAISELARCHPDVWFWADSRRHIREFRNVIIKPNQFEALGGDSPKAGRALSIERLLEQARTLAQETTSPVFLTRGKDGLLVADPEGTLIPGVQLEGPTDPTGAGDSTTAGCVLALCAGADLLEAAIVGNLVASLTVQQLATTGTAQPHQLADRLVLWLSQQNDKAPANRRADTEN